MLLSPHQTNKHTIESFACILLWKQRSEEKKIVTAEAHMETKSKMNA